MVLSLRINEADCKLLHSVYFTLLYVVFVDRATQKKLALDSMYKLEHGADDRSRGNSAVPTIAKVVEMQAAHKDDFLLNQLARKQFRV